MQDLDPYGERWEVRGESSINEGGIISQKKMREALAMLPVLSNMF
jgi:hypothetical protein